jgi:hypothetical protein
MAAPCSMNPNRAMAVCVHHQSATTPGICGWPAHAPAASSPKRVLVANYTVPCCSRLCRWQLPPAVCQRHTFAESVPLLLLQIQAVEAGKMGF